MLFFLSHIFDIFVYFIKKKLLYEKQWLDVCTTKSGLQKYLNEPFHIKCRPKFYKLFIHC